MSIGSSDNNEVNQRNTKSIRRRSSVVTSNGLPPTVEYEELTTSSQVTVVPERLGIFNLDDNDRRHSFSTKLRPVSLGDYLHVLYKYPNYRSYLLSHICQHTGDWFVRIASILIVEELAADGETGELLAFMALATKLPMALFAPVGGVLSDQLDRKTLMITIDFLSGIVVLGFLLAIQLRSLPIFYTVTAFRSALGATYFPVTTGIVPLMVPEPCDLQLAVTMNSWAWGSMAIIGGMVAGSLVAIIGLRACYYIDCVTFFISAMVIKCGVEGNFSVKHSSSALRSTAITALESNIPNNPQTDFASSAEESNAKSYLGEIPSKQQLENPIQEVYQAVRELVVYLFTCGFGMMALLKSSASFVWGIEDIVGAEFATVYNNDGTEDEGLSSLHMGMLFSVVGAGCMAGPAIVNLIADAQRPHTLQRACLFGVFLLMGGWLMISMTNTFPQFLAGTFYRTMVGLK